MVVDGSSIASKLKSENLKSHRDVPCDIAFFFFSVIYLFKIP